MKDTHIRAFIVTAPHLALTLGTVKDTHAAAFAMTAPFLTLTVLHTERLTHKGFHYDILTVHLESGAW